MCHKVYPVGGCSYEACLPKSWRRLGLTPPSPGSGYFLRRSVIAIRIKAMPLKSGGSAFPANRTTIKIPMKATPILRIA